MDNANTELLTCVWYKPCKWSKWVDTHEASDRLNRPIIVQEKVATCCGKKETRIVKPY